MDWVTTTAKSLPEAIDLALGNLGVDEAEAEIVVLEEPKRTFLGRTKGNARVQARLKPKAVKPKQNRERNRRKGPNDRNRQRNNRGGSGSGGGNRSNNSRDGGRNKSSNRGGGNGGGQRDRQNEQHKNNGNETRSGANAGGRGREKQNGENRNNRRNADGGRDQKRNTERGRNNKKAAASAAAVGGAANRGGQTSAQPGPEQETPVEEVSAHLTQFLGGLTEAFGLDGAVAIDDSEDNTLIATVEGQHGLMVGPKGRTLDAIQELARISSQRTAPSTIRIKVDVGGYRAKRNEALANFARQAADRAADNGTEVALEPMTPADRKIVHDALTDDDRVETRSVGSEPRRKVLVEPVAGAATDDSEE